ncbi:membrane protein [Oleiphilus messinensis]|uniref:Membrane protein n=1 Tax=Oleiphilus messinensis TaxID=141451 RepID=A0A1Y0IJ87_9GAMM|nr:hypothetical protein [Oleiphilus messinensis]ARU59454.1 membrane protein [Oleiphilus messinensis]
MHNNRHVLRLRILHRLVYKIDYDYYFIISASNSVATGLQALVVLPVYSNAHDEQQIMIGNLTNLQRYALVALLLLCVGLLQQHSLDAGQDEDHGAECSVCVSGNHTAALPSPFAVPNIIPAPVQWRSFSAEALLRSSTRHFDSRAPPVA